MAANPGEKIFGLDAHANFHGALAHKVYTGLHDHEIADMNWLAEIHSINRRRDACLARVPDGGYSGRGVHHAQDDTAEHVAKIVGVLRHHYLRCFVMGIADTPR